MTIEEAIEQLEEEKNSTRFSHLIKICETFFGSPRTKGSHHIFKTPWPGDPRLNIQSDKGKAKPYQVEQVIYALTKLAQIEEKGSGDKLGTRRIIMAKPKAAKKISHDRAEEYSYTVAWSDEDNAFIGRVVEFQSLAAHGNTQEKALREIRTVVGYILEDLAAGHEPIPEPLGKRCYSGKLNLRMSKELHRRLALESSAQGVSLNTLINTKLARS